MPLRAEQLEAHLAKTLAALYVIHGDEPLLALEAADAIRAAARRTGHAEREVLQVERGFDWSALTHAGASLSLFGGAKIVELRIPSGKPGSEGAGAIVEYCTRAAPEILTIVTLPRLDRASQSSAWFRALADAGTVIDVFPIERARLPAWIGARLARQGQRAASEVLEFIAERVEGNLLAAHQEIQKLALLAPRGTLSLEAVRESVTNVARYDAFDASTALLAGDTARYARVIAGLHNEGEAPTLVLWAIAEDLRALARVQDGVRAGRPLDQLLRENRVWGARQAALRAGLHRVARRSIEQAIRRAAEIDRAIKGVAKTDPWEGFIRLGLELAHGSSA
ncbi:MAG: DNA polymerase III subunit delta [Betaproteobacteria bacterium]|jgi:DNA polymerase-3 subunit delta|nr:DNA polymerase III subunit delta [Betaproteobacteria bacterium]